MATQSLPASIPTISSSQNTETPALGRGRCTDSSGRSGRFASATQTQARESEAEQRERAGLGDGNALGIDLDGLKGPAICGQVVTGALGEPLIPAAVGCRAIQLQRVVTCADVDVTQEEVNGFTFTEGPADGSRGDAGRREERVRRITPPEKAEHGGL